jgi:flagellar hook-length control protein FliK
VPQVASETSVSSHSLPPTRAQSARPSQANGVSSAFDSLIDDSLPPRDPGPGPQTASQDAAASQPPAQTQTDSKPAQTARDDKSPQPADKKAADSDKTAEKGAAGPKADAKSNAKTDAKTGPKAKDATKSADAGKTDGTVTLDPLPAGDEKKADKSEETDKDATAKADTAAKPADAAATNGTPPAPDPTAAQTAAQQSPANAQGQAAANAAPAAIVAAAAQEAPPVEPAVADTDNGSRKTDTPVVSATVAADKIGGPAIPQAVQSGQPAQGTPQAQTPATQDRGPQVAAGNPEPAPAANSNEQAADQKLLADARGETPAKGQRFTLPDASGNTASNTQSTPAPSTTNAAQTLNIPTAVNQPAPQATAAVATAAAAAAAAAATPPQTSAAPVPLASVAVAIATRASAGRNDFSIRLDPPELGRIDVRLSVDKNGHISSHLLADRQDTLSLLQRDASGLQRALQDAGFKTADNGMQFSLRDSFAGQQQQQQQQQPGGGNAGHIVLNDDMPATDAIPADYGRYLGRVGGIDIRV